MRKHPWVDLWEEARYSIWSCYVENGGTKNYSEFCDYMDAKHA